MSRKEIRGRDAAAIKYGSAGHVHLILLLFSRFFFIRFCSRKRVFWYVRPCIHRERGALCVRVCTQREQRGSLWSYSYMTGALCCRVCTQIELFGFRVQHTSREKAKEKEESESCARAATKRCAIHIRSESGREAKQRQRSAREMFRPEDERYFGYLMAILWLLDGVTQHTGSRRRIRISKDST